MLNNTIFRAAENARHLLRSAQSGISADISSNGNVISQSNFNEITIMDVKLGLSNHISFYTEYGEWFSILLGLILLLSIVLRKKAKSYN